MELQPLKVNFFPKLRSKGSDEYTLYMRLTIAGKRTDVSLNYALKKESWDAKSKTLSRKCSDRFYVLNLTNKYNQLAMEVYQQMIHRGIQLDVNFIRQKITGNDKGEVSVEPTLMDLFKRITDRKKALAGRNNSKATQQKYGRCKSHLVAFLKKNYDKEDIKFTQINLQFVEDFELYLKTDGKCGHNSTMKHIQNL